MRALLHPSITLKQALSLQNLASFLVILFAMSIPLSTTATVVITYCVIFIWLIDKGFSQRLQAYFRYELTKPILVLTALSLIGIAYSISSWKGGVSSFHHILRISYIPIFAYYMQQNKHLQRFVLMAFVFAMVYTIFCTMLKVYAHIPIGQRTYANDVFKNHIVTSYFMAFTVFLSCIWLMEAKRYRWVLISIISLALYYLVFLNTGRIGYIMLYLCMCVLAWHRFGIKGAIANCVLLSTLMFFALTFSETFSIRMKDLVSEFYLYTQGFSIASIGARFDYAVNSLRLFAEAPIFGLGSGGFKAGYALYFQGQELTTNPHNQYLKIMVELGLVGLFSFCWLFYKQWQLIKQLNGNALILAQGIFLSFFVGCAFNSLIDNFSECYFYCMMTACLIPFASIKERSATQNT